MYSPDHHRTSVPESVRIDGREDFYAVYLTTASYLRQSQSLRHVSREKLVQFGMDISIVACGMRLGYLFDAFAVRGKRKSIKDLLGECLCDLQKYCPTYRNVRVVHVPTHDQLFFVNAHRLLGRPSPTANTTVASVDIISSTAFIKLQDSCVEHSAPPSRLQSLLADLASLVDASEQQTLAVPEDDRTEDLGTMVAFTACILEFPVAYVPTSSNDGRGFLGGVPLDVYECALEPDASSDTDLPDKHVVLKFSCPQSAASAKPELQPEVVERLLRARFTPRLRDAAFPGRLVVRHSTETLDRVAL